MSRTFRHILSTCRLAVWLAAGLFPASPLWAQGTAPVPSTVEEELHQMADLAGVIFVGEVTGVRQVVGEHGASGVVEVDFRVEQCVRGCSDGATYTLREWAGLWSDGSRYLPGQRALMMLHGAGPAGISSPVAGTAGAIPLRATTPAPRATSSAAATTDEIADLRWVGTHLLRTVSAGTSQTVAPATQPSGDAVGAAAGEDSTPSQQAPVSVVVGMLRSWQPQTR